MNILDLALIATRDMAAVSGESAPWCRRYDRAINYTLIKVIKPECAEKGCYGCEHQYQKETISIRREQ